MRPLALLLPMLLTLAPAARAQNKPEDNPLTPRGAPLPATANEGPSWAGLYLDPDRDLGLILVAEGDGFAGDVTVGRASFPVSGTVAGNQLRGTIRSDRGEWPVEVTLDATGCELRSGQASYRLNRGLNGARAGQMRRQQARASEELGQARVRASEAAAIGALKVLSTSQMLFREADKEGDEVLDYGTLEELGRANLIDPVLASGTKQGYRFTVLVSPEQPEFCWAATAVPLEPGKTGSRSFFVNHAGVIYYRADGAPIEIPASCEVPGGLTPVGR